MHTKEVMKVSRELHNHASANKSYNSELRCYHEAIFLYQLIQPCIIELVWRADHESSLPSISMVMVLLSIFLAVDL